MADVEVERLRRLRGSVLQLRAVAIALAGKSGARSERILERGRCAAWRVARTVSGRLRAHPNASCQQDASVGMAVRHRLVASFVAALAPGRVRALTCFGDRLKRTLRELDNVRAMTWAVDLGDTLDRSQREFRALLAAVDRELAAGAPARDPIVLMPRPSATLGAPRTGIRRQDDWPYMAM